MYRLTKDGGWCECEDSGWARYRSDGSERKHVVKKVRSCRVVTDREWSEVSSGWREVGEEKRAERHRRRKRRVKKEDKEEWWT